MCKFLHLDVILSRLVLGDEESSVHERSFTRKDNLFRMTEEKNLHMA